MSEISRGDLCSIKILQSSCRAPEAARISGVDPLLSATSDLSRKGNIANCRNQVPAGRQLGLARDIEQLPPSGRGWRA